MTSSKIADASQALMARLYVPSAQDMALVDAFVKQVNMFYEQGWQACRKCVEEGDLRWF